jgi:allantoinase
MGKLASEPAMLMFHAEMLPISPPANLLEEAAPPFLYPIPARDQNYQYAEFLASRPPSFEVRAVNELIELAKSNDSPPIHIAHVSTAEVLPIINNAQREGVNISAETCFHYISLAAEDVPVRDTRYKAEPPIREGVNKSKLWSSLLLSRIEEEKMAYRAASEKPYVSPLRQQPISMVVSDHSPCAPADKLLPSYIPPHAEPPAYHDDVIKRANGDFFRAWGGISSLGLGLPILWTELSRRNPSADTEFETSTRSHQETLLLLQLSAWLSANPARLVGLERQKGSLEVGFDGDVLIFDPDVFWTLESADMKFRHKMSPYQGRTFRGRVCETWLRCNKIYELGAESGGFGQGKAPMGLLLLEPRRWHAERPLHQCDCGPNVREFECGEKMTQESSEVDASAGFLKDVFSGCFGWNRISM